MSRPPRPNGPRGLYPTCPTHELLMFELAREAQELTRVLTQWTIVAGPAARGKVHNPQPELGLKQPPAPRKARTHG